MAKKIKTYAAGVVLISFGGMLFYLFFRYAFGVLAPFLFGYLLSVLTRKPAAFLHNRYRLPEGLLRLLLALLLSFGVGALLFFSAKVLLHEIYVFSENLRLDIPKAVEEFFSRVPLLRTLWQEGAVWEKAVSALMSFLPSLLSSLVSFLPSLLLSLGVGAIAAVYFCLDLDRIHAALARLVPLRWQDTLLRGKRHLTTAFYTLFKSSGILMLIAFALMLLGFTLLRIPYPFLFSAVFSLFDLLPVIGVGAFLVPMGLVKLLVGDTLGGVGILVLFGVITVVRQLLEPRLLGADSGAHPLLILFSLYAGARLFGAVGLIFFPVFTLLLYSLFFTEKETANGEKRREVPRHPS